MFEAYKTVGLDMAFLKVFSPHCILHTTLGQEIIHYHTLWFECNLKVTFY